MEAGTTTIKMYEVFYTFRNYYIEINIALQYFNYDRILKLKSCKNY